MSYYQGGLALIVTYMSTGRKSSAPASTCSDIAALSNRLLITLQQFIMLKSFSWGALKALIFCNSFSAS